MNSSRFSSTRASVVQAAAVGVAADVAAVGAAASASLAASSSRSSRSGDSLRPLGVAGQAEAEGVGESARRRRGRLARARGRPGPGRTRRTPASLSSVSACSGVFERIRRVQAWTRVGGVEDGQRRVRRGAARRTCRGRGGSGRGPCSAFQLALASGRGVMTPVGLRREDARAADLRRQQPARRQGRVADRSRRRAAAATAARAGGCRGSIAARSGRTLRRLAVGRRGDDQPVHRLEAPALSRRTRSASQSSSSGCVGGVPWVPKSFSVSTSPRPKYACQSRLTVTRAVSGFAGSTSQRARSSRFGRVAGGSAAAAGRPGRPGATGSPLRVKSPPRWTMRLARASSARGRPSS